ncbi:MAG: MBL fold metallo-hydrolase [Bifidobacteriaceae bacterium]|jgi:ribonuclease BN (tRNA processing enzyme)|nr:MBL fold metallo-hydrolase [Bifidobacteriaceae bacterium]
MAGPDSPASCYLVQTDDSAGRTWSLVLDLGSGAFGRLQRHIDPAHIDAVCLSHLHADHCADIVGLAVWAKWAPGGPLAPIPVYGPSDTVSRIRQLTDHGRGEHINAVHGAHGRTAGGAFAVRTWKPGVTVNVGPFRITPWPARHPVEAYALRVVAPSSTPGGEVTLAYTGDGDEGPGCEAAARGAGLLLAEAGFVEGRDAVRGVHMTASQAAELAAGAGVETLVLTHVAPWDDRDVAVRAAEVIFTGQVYAATPGAVHRVEGAPAGAAE